MNAINTAIIERHPWEPFLPQNARLLILGSFPPQRHRWSMDFYYPNITNDFWKIMGFIFYDDTTRFILNDKKEFNQPLIKEFLEEKGIALYDAATAVIRKQNNASDLHLKIIEATDPEKLLIKIPYCKNIAVTGEKAMQTLLSPFDAPHPAIGHSTFIPALGNGTTIWRMPSTSRAYPFALEKKASFYRKLFIATKILSE